MKPAGGAVFLSYASEDADAARRICEALRSAGVEVWFDQSELVGGDAWDAKIETPDVRAVRADHSAHAALKKATRRSGIWREPTRTWRTTLLLPVVIDATAAARPIVAIEPRSQYLNVAAAWCRTRGGQSRGRDLIKQGLKEVVILCPRG